MLTIEEKQVVIAHLQRRFVGDALRVLALNVLPTTFVWATQITSIWFYLGWFVIGGLVVASSGISIARVSIPSLPLNERIPNDIYTLRRGALLLLIHAIVTSISYLAVS